MQPAKMVTEDNWDSRALESNMLSYGVVTEHVHVNLVTYGHMVISGTVMAECLVDIQKHVVDYLIVLDTKSFLLWETQQKISKKSGLLGGVMLYGYLKTFGNYDPQILLSQWITGYLGKLWKTKVEVLSAAQYQQQLSGSRPKGWFLQKRDQCDSEVH